MRGVRHEVVCSVETQPEDNRILRSQVLELLLSRYACLASSAAPVTVELREEQGRMVGRASTRCAECLRTSGGHRFEFNEGLMYERCERCLLPAAQWSGALCPNPPID